MRRAYERTGVAPRPRAGPAGAFRRWFEEVASAGSSSECHGACHVGANGAPAARTVLLKGTPRTAALLHQPPLGEGHRPGDGPYEGWRLVFPWPRGVAPGAGDRHGVPAGPGGSRGLLRDPAERRAARCVGQQPVGGGRLAGRAGRGVAAVAERFPGDVPAPPFWAATSWRRSRGVLGRPGRPPCTTGCAIGVPPTAGRSSASPPEARRRPRNDHASVIISPLGAACRPRPVGRSPPRMRSGARGHAPEQQRPAGLRVEGTFPPQPAGRVTAWDSPALLFEPVIRRRRVLLVALAGSHLTRPKVLTCVGPPPFRVRRRYDARARITSH